ncbi:MAG: hypothetical protein CVU40_17485 [Chloroflexi bacterium HGW-Chloroflexi-2]|jgi:hypothetical protein|nr:MAG: hypothetical protein CVU40_17485 [Chloroflexi bacterium HGW-Chloroflexi-2]
MKKFLSFLLILLITACSPGSLVEPTLLPTEILPTATFTPTNTPTITPTPTATATPEPTLTPTPLPLTEEELNSLRQAYQILLFIQIDSNMLEETATKVNNGELAGFEALGALLGLATIIDEVNKGIAVTTPLPFLKPYWEDALMIHEETKTLLGDWFNKKIDSSIVMEKTPALNASIEKIMVDLEKELSGINGIDAEELKKVRDEAIQSIGEIFETSTP